VSEEKSRCNNTVRRHHADKYYHDPELQAPHCVLEHVALALADEELGGHGDGLDEEGDGQGPVAQVALKEHEGARREE
jgi:hypothetical protein